MREKVRTSRYLGLQVPYEPPDDPEFVVRGDQENAATAAALVIRLLAEKGYAANIKPISA